MQVSCNKVGKSTKSPEAGILESKRNNRHSIHQEILNSILTYVPPAFSAHLVSQRVCSAILRLTMRCTLRSIPSKAVSVVV